MPGYGFPRKLRLTEAAQFKTVFSKSSWKVSNRYFLILAKENQLEYGRLGLVVGKKILPKATQRNRLKRLLRTGFRLNQDLLVGLDIVILARSNMLGLENAVIMNHFQCLLNDLVKKTGPTLHDTTYQEA